MACACSFDVGTDGVRPRGVVAHGESSECDGRHVDVEIDAIGERTGKPGAVSVEFRDGTSAVSIVAAGVAAGARIGGGNQCKARWKADGTGGAGDDDQSIFEWLTQRFECVARKE